jgi:hypothetical protein
VTGIDQSLTWCTSFENARRVNRRRFWKSTNRSGLGGTVIGIHPTVTARGVPLRLEPAKGFRIAVTALLRFSDHPKPSETEAQLELVNPRIEDSIQLGKRRYSLAADFTAPVAAYAKVNELWAGIINMIWGEKTGSKSGLYLLEPYDPNRIPVLVNSKPLLRDALLFRANPLVKRIIFISTPHRGSAIASGGIGALGDRLIRLPAIITSSVPRQIARLANARGMRIPTSIDGLSPKSPLFRVYDRLPIRSPHHSIIGDRGRGDTPNSSDGVVPYWSSHLDTASSELIVPTGHGAMNNSLAIAEIQRILRLNAGAARRNLASSGQGR